MTNSASGHATDAPTLCELRESAANEFRARFDREPQCVAAAPGRVNIIGEHTDYNGGFVLPMAIERYVVIAAAPKIGDAVKGQVASVFSSSKQELAELKTGGEIEPGPVAWSSYVQGVIAGFVARGIVPTAFDAVIQSNVPLGGGLSSSAALEVATATLVEALTGRKLQPIQKALLCQEAEHRYARVPCGIMDQFSSVLCTKDHLMLLDCRSQFAKSVPFTDAGITVLITNSNVKHELTGGEYAQRRAQCEAAAKVLRVETLRDATMAQLEEAKSKLDEVHFRRARHVIGEIDRTTKAAEAIAEGNWSEVGRLMYASHDSLRGDYEVSCSELDVLVEIAKEIGAAGGVIGSRMTGGGFGGCTVSLVKSDAADRVAATLRSKYQQRVGIEPTLFASRPAQGASVLSGGR
jgi:galactokinase